VGGLQHADTHPPQYGWSHAAPGWDGNATDVRGYYTWAQALPLSAKKRRPLKPGHTGQGHPRTHMQKPASALNLQCQVALPSRRNRVRRACCTTGNCNWYGFGNDEANAFADAFERHKMEASLRDLRNCTADVDSDRNRARTPR